jgi:hypothetical protein
VPLISNHNLPEIGVISFFRLQVKMGNPTLLDPLAEVVRVQGLRLALPRGPTEYSSAS